MAAMDRIVRLSFSIEKPLLKRLEELIRDGQYTNRSEFIRDLIRDQLVQKEWERNEEAVGTVTLLYNHHSHGLSDALTHLQHHYHHVILASTHIHLDKELCAEIVVVKGRAKEIQQLSSMLRQQKGVLHATLSVSSTGKHLA
jgi:CopG family transcriptional regulator, nickel-responsive regulator